MQGCGAPTKTACPIRRRGKKSPHIEKHTQLFRKVHVPNTTSRANAHQNAQHYFSRADRQSETLAKKLQKKERVAGAANTARLRALRLAKEAAEKQANEAAGIDSNLPKRARKAKSVVRMSY